MIHQLNYYYYLYNYTIGYIMINQLNSILNRFLQLAAALCLFEEAECRNVRHRLRLPRLGVHRGGQELFEEA